MDPFASALELAAAVRGVLDVGNADPSARARPLPARPPGLPPLG